MYELNTKDNTIIKTIQRFLYCHPIYNWSDLSNPVMKLLVVGDNEFACRFVDQVLQTGQMADKRLIVVWCTADTNTKTDYLSARPALKDFVSVDSAAVTWIPYAELVFRNIDDAIDAFGNDCRYVLVATDDYGYNAETAELFKQAGRSDCLAAYLTPDSVEVSFSGEPDAPEFEEVLDASLRIPTFDELERMAFNTHLVWEGSGNLDYDGLKSRFDQPYNYEASVSFVLSIPYKLRSVGIKTANPYAAAKELSRIIEAARNDPESPEAVLLSRLAVLEHRRWIMEKVAAGVTRLVNSNGIPEYASCVERASVKRNDNEGRLIMHPCLVPSTEKTPLKTGAFASHTAWDDSSVRTDTLDELDKVSINIHREMFRKAGSIRNAKRKELNNEIEKLQAVCQCGDEILKRNFDRYNFCIENILDRSLPYASQFETYERMLKESLACILQVDGCMEYGDKDGEIKTFTSSDAENCISGIRRMLFPVIESNMYRDYKNYDIQLVNRIPYILTAKRDISICMPLGEASSKKSNNADHFQSVASPTALYADRITYLYVLSRNTNPAALESKLKAVSNFFYYRGRKCTISIALFTCRALYDPTDISMITDVLDRSKISKYISGYSVKETGDPDELADEMIRFIEADAADYFDGTNALLESNILNGRFLDRVCKIIPYFEFDSYHKSFLNCINCEYLRYTDISSFIQVEDMFALLNAKDKEFNYQDYSDCYLKLWDIYCGDDEYEPDFAFSAQCWTRLVEVLQRADKTDKLEVRNVPIGTSNTNELKLVNQMLRNLYKNGFLTRLDNEKNYSKTSVTCTIKDYKTKKILTKNGDLLEVYVFFEACKTGWFDDVQTGYSFMWEFDNVFNELDCVLTKGYRSIFVECKSTIKSNEDYYLKLDSLADHFGIGYKKVMIIVTDTATSSSKNYHLQKSRGRQMDIITISGKDDLKNIGKKLIRIMEEE
ncbi:MAG: DUF1887 family protein [Lachnospiraceae bacterium]|nr:DUF1887 family protein [Lachnospiraceae bacterium]